MISCVLRIDHGSRFRISNELGNNPMKVIVQSQSFGLHCLLQEELDFGKMCVGQAKWWKQLSTLTKRSTINMSRDLGYYWLRIAIYIALSICVGTVFYNLGTNYPAIFARGACGGFISGFMAFMSIGGFPSFIEEMKVNTLTLQLGHRSRYVYNF